MGSSLPGFPDSFLNNFKSSEVSGMSADLDSYYFHSR